MDARNEKIETYYEGCEGSLTFRNRNYTLRKSKSCPLGGGGASLGNIVFCFPLTGCILRLRVCRRGEKKSMCALLRIHTSRTSF